MAVLDAEERQRRRASNLIWNSAGDYGFKPFTRAYDEEGYADVYFNSVIGAACKYCGYEPLRDLFASLGAGERSEEYAELIWLGLEGLVFERARQERPAFGALREKYARETLKLLERRGDRELTETERLRRAHYAAALGEKAPLNERERGIIAGMTFTPEQTAQEISAQALATLSHYYAFAPRKEIRRAFRLPRWLRPRNLKYSGLSTEEEAEDGDGFLGKLRALLRGERTQPAVRDYLERCFGLPIYSSERMEELERTVCTGVNRGCRLHITKGEYSSDEVHDTETALHRRRDADRLEENRRAFYAELPRNSTEIMRLTERIRNTLLVYLDPTPVKARAGTLRADRVWRAQYLGDGAVFERPERGEAGELAVDILLDASASQTYRQESVSTQGYIIAESLERCGIPVRVLCFCSVEGSTVLRILRDYSDSGKNDGVFAYSAEGWNRDGLAIRAAGELMEASPGSDRLLIVLSDVAPNDSSRIGGTRRAYTGKDGIEDTAAEVDALRRRGIPVVCVFTGSEDSLPAARRVYGRDLACIRSINQFADTVGSIIQEKLRAM